MVKQIPWWAQVSSGAAPILLVGGWTLAESLQPPGYNLTRDTISALAAYGATDRWVMTSALAGLGACHVITALGLRPAKSGGRVVLASGGLATILVAAFAQPARGNSVAHTVAATVSFTALGAWPLFASQSNSAPLLSRSISTAAAVVLLGLAAWFALDLHGSERGLSERAAAGAQALWPLAVVTTTRWLSTRRSRKNLSQVVAHRN